MEVPRRRLFAGLIYGLWTAIGTALGAPAFVYLFFPPRARKANEWVEAGEISRLEAGTPVEVVFRRNRIDGWKLTSEKDTAWVVRRPDGRIAAFGPQCTHLGCAYRWDEDRNAFLCPCHNSVFGVDGRVVSGPAPRPLDRYETRTDKGRLLLGPLKQS